MVRNRKVSGRAVTAPVGLLMGVGTSLLVTLSISAWIANLVLNEKLAEVWIGYGATATILVSSWIGALISAATIKRRWAMICGVNGVIYFLALLSITALFFGGQYEGMGVTLLLVLCGTGVAVLMGAKRGVGQGRKKRKYRVR